MTSGSGGAPDNPLDRLVEWAMGADVLLEYSDEAADDRTIMLGRALTHDGVERTLAWCGGLPEADSVRGLHEVVAGRL